jgi:ribose transport system substrate-binding protein
MLRPRKVFSLLVLVVLTLLTVTCGSRHDSDENYYLVGTNIKIPYWETAGAGFSAAGSQLRVRTAFVGPDTYDANAEKQAFEEAAQKKPSGILVAVADPAMMKDSIDRAIAAGIPVITVDSDAPASKRLFFVGTNNHQAGFMGGKRLAQELKGKGNVVVFTMPEQTNLAERLQGYRDALESSPQIKITRVVDIKGDPRIAFDSTTEILGKEKDKVDAFVCLEAQSGPEVATVLNNYNIQNKVVIAMDTDASTLDWVQKGVIAATISQKPYTMTFVGLHVLDDLYHNKLSRLDSDWSRDSFAPVPAFIDTGSVLIDKGNVAAFQESKKSATGASK